MRRAAGTRPPLTASRRAALPTLVVYLLTLLAAAFLPGPAGADDAVEICTGDGLKRIPLPGHDTPRPASHASLACCVIHCGGHAALPQRAPSAAVPAHDGAVASSPERPTPCRSGAIATAPPPSRAPPSA